MYHISCLHNADQTHETSHLFCMSTANMATYRASVPLMPVLSFRDLCLLAKTLHQSPAHAFCGPAGIPVLLGPACPCRIASLLSFPSRHSSERFSRFHFLLVAVPTCMNKKKKKFLNAFSYWSGASSLREHHYYKCSYYV